MQSFVREEEEEEEKSVYYQSKSHLPVQRVVHFTRQYTQRVT